MRHIAFAELRGDPTPTPTGVRLAGRCHSGPIAVGDTFTAVVAGETPHPATLRVETLLFYGRPVPRLDEGDTAELHLTGDAAQVIPGVLLTGDVP